METDRTDKAILVKGLKILGGSLFCMFTGPTLFHISQTQLKPPFDIIVTVLAGLICLLAVFLAFRGINTILNSMFKSK